MNSSQGIPQGVQGGQMPQNGQFPQGGFAGGPGGHGGPGIVPGGPAGMIVILAIFAITLIVLAIVFYNAFQKAGMNGALGILMAIPVVNLGVGLWFAFSDWPIIAELAKVKLQSASAVPVMTPTTAATPPLAETPVDPA